MLSDDILSLNDAQVERVPVPEWGALGEHVFVRVMTGAERDAWEYSIMQMDGDKSKFFQGVRARLAQLTACDDKGVLLFKTEHIPALSQKSAPALQRIYDAAMRLNKLGKSDVDELEKNSVSATSAVSGSDSRRSLECQSDSASAL